MKQRFYITVRGKKVTVDYTKNFPSGKPAKRYGDKVYATQHFEFRTKGPGPISETGYRSHFVNGTTSQLGLTKKNIRQKIIKTAETLADEYKGKTV